MTAENRNAGDLQKGPDQHNLSIQGGVDKSIILQGDRNTIHQGHSYYTTNVFSSFDTNQFPARPSQLISQQEYRWRQVLVQNVKHYWIEGVLEKSLHNQALIELGLEGRVRAVASPLSGVEEFADEPDKPFPEGTQATDIFDSLGPGRTLLILGAPGAGKTTILLKLAQTLITRIGGDFSQPIPVILNLSSWAKKREPISEWLVQDLYNTFQVSKALGTTWIKEEQLTLCLDGLDEVAAQCRNDCVEALNQFIQDHGRTEVVICSRIRDYEALSAQLRAKCAIYVQPLTAQQIDQYVEQAGEQLSALRTLFSHSSEIRSFAASPLILSVMSLAYQGHSLKNVPEVKNNVEVFRQRLFDTYIERMFQRRGTTHQYDDDHQVKYWLSWMSTQMIRTSQTVFFIENIQPDWLQTRAQKIRNQLESSLVVGLVVGLVVSLAVGLIDELIVGIIYGLSAGLSASLVDLTVVGITPVETLKWSWSEAGSSIRIGARSGLIVGLFCGLGSGLFFGLTAGIVLAVVGTLGCMLPLILICALKGPDMGNKTVPNQGIWKSIRNAGLFALIFGLIGGLTGWILDILFDNFLGNINHSVTGTLMGGFAGGMMGGASAGLRHFTLRFRLYSIGYIPWNYARFLDYAAERLFLQKVGGGYIFIHRMLLEHFARHCQVTVK